MNNSPPSSANDSLAVSAPLPTEPQKGTRGGRVSLQARLRRWWWHRLVRLITLLCLVAMRIAGWIGRRRRSCDSTGLDILLTGRFDSANWILAHLGPLAASRKCSHLWMVSTNPVPSLPKVEGIYPPRWLIRIAGVTPARLLTFSWAAMWKRPHVVGGFHMIPNGIAAVITGRLAGSRSLYFCVGGPAEVRDGGTHSTDSFFARMGTADPVVERRLVKVVAESDTIITMGTRAVEFFREKGITSDFQVVSGGIDATRFQPAQGTPSYDLVLTGRLAQVKRIDMFLRAVQIVAAKIPDVRAVVVGDGALRDELRMLCAQLRIDRNVSFAGHQSDVESWLHKSRIFVLTSDSEGLSLAMMEAMMCGLPVVVSDVGDLADLVESGVNGYLVPRRCPELFADRIIELLRDGPKLASFALAARRAALRYETQATVHQWDCILAADRRS